VVAADVMYEPITGRALAHRVVEALKKQRSRVLIGDSPGRPGRPAFLAALQEELGLQNLDFVNVTGQTVTGPRNELICGKTSQTVSTRPQALTVAVLDLDPNNLDLPPLKD
jgi:hypothetical protein